jgi:hypothetical protein
MQITITQTHEKENQHMNQLLLIKLLKNKTKTSKLTLAPNIGKLIEFIWNENAQNFSSLEVLKSS